MNGFWQSLEEIPGQTAGPAEWRGWVGTDFDVLQERFFTRGKDRALAVPCPKQCGCEHDVVDHDDGTLVGVCSCDPWKCENIELSAADAARWGLDWKRFGRAIAKAFGVEPKESDLAAPACVQIAALGTDLPVILTIHGDGEEFRSAMAQLVTQLHEHFVVLAPTARFYNAHTAGLLRNAHAGFFDLETWMKLTPNGLRALKSGGELFSPFLPAMKEAVSDNVARQLFALLEQLDSETVVRKAPVSQVFRLYCVKGLSRNEVAKRCGCVPSLITERLHAIHRKLGRKPIELRVLSSQFESIDDSLSDSRARHIHRKSALDDGRSDEK